MKVQLVKIQQRQLTTYFDIIDTYHYRNYSHLHDISLENNIAKGKFSRKSKSRFTNIIKNMISVYETYRISNNLSNKFYDYKIVFVTLTLSDKQKHTDKYIRRHMLNRFLQELKRKHNVTSYLYVSEAQENGNIHFHIVINHYVHHKAIRDIWNKIQNDNGYLNKYYKEHKHKNANSTDIHSFKKINAIEAYLIKYFTKTENRRKIEGHLSGCSDNLRQIEPLTLEVEDDIIKLFNYRNTKHTNTVYKAEYFNVFKDIQFMSLKTYYPSLFKQIEVHYSQYYNLLNLN